MVPCFIDDMRVPYDSGYARDSMRHYIDTVNAYGHSTSVTQSVCLTNMGQGSSTDNVVFPAVDIRLCEGFGDIEEFRVCQRLHEGRWNHWLDSGMYQSERPILDIHEIEVDHAKFTEAEAWQTISSQKFQKALQ